MGGIPLVFQQKLGELMHILLTRSYIQDPQILFGAFGDATSDHIALQVGQFESGVELGYHVGTRGNGIDQPVWPKDLTVEH